MVEAGAVGPVWGLLGMGLIFGLGFLLGWKLHGWNR